MSASKEAPQKWAPLPSPETLNQACQVGLRKHELVTLLESLKDMCDGVETLEGIAGAGPRLTAQAVTEARTLAVGFALDTGEVLTALLRAKSLQSESESDVQWRRALRRRAQEATARFGAAMSTLSPWTGLVAWTLQQTAHEGSSPTAHLELKFEPATQIAL